MSETRKTATGESMPLFGKRIPILRALAAGICGELLWLAMWIAPAKSGNREEAWFAFFHQPVVDALNVGIVGHSKPFAWVLACALYSFGLSVLWVAILYVVRRACHGVYVIYNEIRWLRFRERVSWFGLFGALVAPVLTIAFWFPQQSKVGSDDSVFLVVEPAVPGVSERRLCLVNESKYPVFVSQRSGVPCTFSRHFVDNHWVEPPTGGIFCGTGMTYRRVLPFHRFLIATLDENGNGNADTLKSQVGLDYTINDGTESLRSGTAWSGVLH